MDIGQYIKQLRTGRNLTQEELGKIVGVQRAAVQKWESGMTQNLKRTTIQKLADLFGVSPSSFINKDFEYVQSTNDVFNISNIIPLPKTKLVPLLGTIACGSPTFAVENIEEYIHMSAGINATFALKCNGDSMINARIFDGDIVYIREQPDVEDGEIAAVRIGNEATLKRVYKYPNKLVLRACNPVYDDMVYTESDLDEIAIIGKAVAFISLIR